MVVVLSRAEMQALDRRTIEGLGLPSRVLMEVAGRAVADAVTALAAGALRPVVALLGTGNNAGDAVVAARHLLARGHPVRLLELGPPERRSADLAEQLAIALRLGLSPEPLADPGQLFSTLGDGPVVIDGLFGVGLARAVEEPYRGVIAALNASGLEVVAVDLPSGVDADTGQVQGIAVEATVTVTFQHPKPGLLLHPGRALAGTLIVADIGLPPQLLPAPAARGEWLEPTCLAEAWPPRAPNSHKGTYGHLLVVAGAPDRPGAALMAGRAAQRAGAGLVTIASDGETIARIAGSFDELMGQSLPELSTEVILAAAEQKTALAIGPSLAPTAALKAIVAGVLSRAAAPCVLDAGALTAFAGAAADLAQHRAPLVLTPHPGEAGRLLGLDTAAVQRDRPAAARTLARSARAVVILKGATTVIAEPDGRLAFCTRGNPGLAKGGSGDVLTGIVGALLAQGVAPELAARAAVFAHGVAADRVAARVGEVALLPSDLLPELGRVAQGEVEG